MGIDYGEIVKTLEAEAKRQPWGDELPMAFDDRPFRDAANSDVFVRHSITFGDGEPTSLGGGCLRYPGIQFLSLFYRGGHGNASIYNHASKIVNHYNFKTLGRVVFQVASTIKLPQDADGFSQLQVVCPFYFDVYR